MRFAVIDRERPDVDSKLGDNGSDWFDVSRDRVGKRQALDLPLVARFTNDRWDNAVGVCDQFDTRLDDDALGSFHGSRRITQFLQWAAPPPLTRVTQAERRELRLAVSSVAGNRRLRAAVCARSSNSACCRWRAASTRPLSCFGCTRSARLVHDAGLALRLSRRPLRRFNTLAPLDARISGSQRNAIVSCTRAQSLLLLFDSWLRYYASDFLARWGAPTRARAALVAERHSAMCVCDGSRTTRGCATTKLAFTRARRARTLRASNATSGSSTT
jgi:hypothetical protein